MNRQIEALRIEHLDQVSKGLPFGADTTPADVERLKWNVVEGDLTFPLMVIRQSALEHNLRVMDSWCADNNLLLAPHGKTTMCPQIYERQIAHGAWAITVANVAQAMVCASFGIPRIIIANQIAGTGNLRALAGLINDIQQTELYCLVDSVPGIEHLAAGLKRFEAKSPINVFVEVGRTGWRTGVRTDRQFLDVFEAAMRYPQLLTVRGIEAFEGSAADTADLDEFLAEFKYVGSRLLKSWGGSDKPLASIGGSAFLDRVLNYSREMSDGFQVVVRSGCYVTHDHGIYHRKHGSSLQRIKGKGFIPEFFPALELWSYVQSVPEKQLAFLTFGKRDASHDLDLPIPLFSLRDGRRQSLAGAEVTKLNDQHAYLNLIDGIDLQVGDLVCCGLSHPCTAFDKWRVIPVVDDEHNIVDLYRTFF